MVSLIRLFVDQNLSLGNQIMIKKGHVHYLKHVMRLKVGAEFLLFNGWDGEFLGQILEIDKKRFVVDIKNQIRRQSFDSDIWLLFSPIKRTSINFIAEKSTELGVSKILPVITDYTNNNRVNTERLNSIAIEAAEQCQRLTVPNITAPKGLAEVLDKWDSSRRLLVMDETQAMKGDVTKDAVRMSDLINIDNKKPCDAILIGPEGGFSPSEFDKLSKLTFVQRITLGPRLLRAETAATVALGLWNELIDNRNLLRK